MNKNKKQKNQKIVKCAISGNYISQGNAKCSNIASNNTTYYSEQYEQLFDNSTSENLVNALLTCVVIGGTLKVNNNTLQAYNTIASDMLYTIYFNNGIVLYCNGTNAQVKKYLNQLTIYKKAIKTITYKDIYDNEIALQDISDNPTYIRQKYLYSIGLSYNPDSKKTINKKW